MNDQQLGKRNHENGDEKPHRPNKRQKTENHGTKSTVDSRNKVVEHLIDSKSMMDDSTDL